jgi:intron-binding protein aquarius
MAGYPADKIAILSTYNGQKHLIRDVLQKRCAWCARHAGARTPHQGRRTKDEPLGLRRAARRTPVFGMPHRVTTVDRFQGQQNDYVLLSLVRTKTVGHLRDVRRLVVRRRGTSDRPGRTDVARQVAVGLTQARRGQVALSRARLGLYVFCRASVFNDCFELRPAFAQLMARPATLQLVGGEAEEKYGEKQHPKRADHVRALNPCH